MGSPAIFSGRRTKLLTADGLLKSNGSIIDNDGVRNYIANGHAEVNTAGYATYLNTTSPMSRPNPTVTLTSTVLAITSSATAPLMGSKSFLLTKGLATNNQGEAVFYDFTIDAKDKAKMSQIGFDYIVDSGTFNAGTSTTDSDIVIGIIDLTNAVYIEPSNIKLLSNSTTIADRFSATFQTASNSVSYRLCFHTAGTGTNTYALKVDNISVSPSVYVYGSPVTDEVAYTPSFINTTNFTVTKSVWGRVGDKMRVQGFLTWTGAGVGAGAFTISIPAGHTIDTNKISATGVNKIGDFNWQDSGIDNKFGMVMYGNTTVVQLLKEAVGVLPGTSFTNGDTLAYTFEIPILGWSSSTQMSDGYDGRIIAANRKATGATGAGIDMVFATLSMDKTNSTTTTRFTAPSAGTYSISFSAFYTLAASAKVELYILRNGVVVSAKSFSGSGGGTSSIEPVACTVLDLNTGDYLTFQWQNFVNTGTNASNGTNFGEFSVFKLSGSATISATEICKSTITQTSGQSIPNAAATRLQGVVVKDTHGLWNPSNSEWTQNRAGTGKISGCFHMVVGASTMTILTELYKDGVSVNTRYLTVASVANNYPLDYFWETDGVVGTKWAVYVYQGSGSARLILNNPVYNQITFKLD